MSRKSPSRKSPSRKSPSRKPPSRKPQCGTLVLTITLLFAAASAAIGQEEAASTRGYLGIGFDSAGHSAIVTSVTPEGPAEQAGVRVGDSVHEFNGAEFHFGSDLALIKGLRWIEAGEPVDLRIVRDGESLTVRVMPDPLASEQSQELDRWIERQEMRERELAKACAQEEFDELVAQSPVTLTLGKSAEDESITVESPTELPPNLDLAGSDPLISKIFETLRPGDQAVLRYAMEDGVLNVYMLELPEYVEAAAKGI